ncbi:putative Methyltransferase domain-containing protein [Seiridium unicorne]|uniref:Methyltransferase domain-containing protein n=1 Tax=Seiridium unicorne TaxID=138068 RepID=A0ABR2VBA9_9PEZI
MMSAVISAADDRRYHGTDSTYLLPNDTIEQDRLDAQAAAIVEMVGGFPVLAPVQGLRGSVAKAVDVGCGTGVATLQIASMLSSATVYGLDISSVAKSTQETAPSNVAWVVGNILHVDHSNPAGDDFMTRRVFAPGSIDYVFGRMLFLGINDWTRYFSVVTPSLAPGGYIEQQDLDWKFYRVGTNECLSDRWEWHQKVVSAIEKLGMSARAGSNAQYMMEKEGLEVISVQTFEFSFVPSTRMPQSQAMGRYVQAKLIPQYPELLRKLLGTINITGYELARLTRECLHDIGSEEGIHQKYTVTVAKKRQI